MKSFIDLLSHRRSCRKYKDQKVADSSLELIKKAALLSPTSKNNRPWEFIFIDTPETIKELSNSKPHGSSFLKYAPLAVVIVADPSKSDVWIEDDSIAATNIQLIAEDLGLGSCWIQIRKRAYNEEQTASDRVKQLLNIPNELEVASIIAIGHKEKERPAYSDSDLLTERIHLNQW